MPLLTRLSRLVLLSGVTGAKKTAGPRALCSSWEHYARKWTRNAHAVPPGHMIRYLGDEWTVEQPQAGRATTYGLSATDIDIFAEFLRRQLLDVYLPPEADEGLEIGSGGGRLTELLVPRTRRLHVADVSETMLLSLRERFRTWTSIHYHLTDGKSLPRLETESLDYVIAFDVFVHFEARLVYWYLRQLLPLMKRGGVGIIHYSNILTPIGWNQFAIDLEENVEQRSSFSAFGVMCPAIMGRFLEALGFEILALDIALIPRDAITVFRRPVAAASNHS